MINEFFEGIANIIIRKPKLMAGLVLVFLCIGLYGVTMLSMQTGWDTYIDKDSPGGALQAKYEDNFKSDAIILIVEAGDPLSPEVLAYIDNLEQDFRQQQNICLGFFGFIYHSQNCFSIFTWLSRFFFYLTAGYFYFHLTTPLKFGII